MFARTTGLLKVLLVSVSRDFILDNEIWNSLAASVLKMHVSTCIMVGNGLFAYFSEVSNRKRWSNADKEHFNQNYCYCVRLRFTLGYNRRSVHNCRSYSRTDSTNNIKWNYLHLKPIPIGFPLINGAIEASNKISDFCWHSSSSKQIQQKRKTQRRSCK